VDSPITDSELERLRQSVNRQSPFALSEWVVDVCQRFGLESTIRKRGRQGRRSKINLSFFLCIALFRFSSLPLLILVMFSLCEFCLLFNNINQVLLLTDLARLKIRLLTGVAGQDNLITKRGRTGENY